FYDLCVQNGGSRCNPSPDDNGDVKLVPMLEIERPAGSATLPPTADLANYGSVTRPRTGGGTIAYVPLQLVTDDRTGARVAFSGRMLYRPGAAGWGGAHRVRLTWLVQMLVDQCQGYAAGVCNDYTDASGQDTHNQIQVVHSYY